LILRPSFDTLCGPTACRQAAGQPRVPAPSEASRRRQLMAAAGSCSVPC
jgi:hypothetical protein